MEDLFAGAEVISVYTNAQAVEDGEKVELFKNRWPQLSGGKPITCTRSLFEEFSLAAFVEMWNGAAVVLKGGRLRGFRVSYALDADGQPIPGSGFVITKMNMQPVWLMEDGEAWTFLRPSER